MQSNTKQTAKQDKDFYKQEIKRLIDTFEEESKIILIYEIVIRLL